MTTSNAEATVRPGKLIVCSGVEGSGKSSNIKRLWDEFPNLYPIAFPGGNLYGDHVRSIVKHHKPYRLHPPSIFHLIWSNFCDVHHEIMKPRLLRGQSLLLDRFTPDSYAYQGWKIFPGPQEFFQLHEWIGFPPIDAWLWFDVDPQTGLARRQRDGNVDVFDAQDLPFHQRVQQAFGYVWAANIPQIKNKIRIDANQDSEMVYQDVKRKVLPFLT